MKGGRLLSLDALRGFDMVWIMGLAGVVRAFAGLFPGGSEGWVCQQLHHAAGVGFTCYDLIFPLFLFMAGVSWPFSYASQVKKGVPAGRIHLRILRRVLILAAVQMVQSGALWFDPAKYTYPSVLIRIALPWAIAALVYMHCAPKVRIGIAAGGVLAYWALLAFVPSPLLPAGAAFDYGDWTTSHVAWANQFLSFRAWIGHDPFEMMDIPLSIVQVPLALIGMFAGDLVRRESASPARRSGSLALLGVGLLGAAFVFLAIGCPVSKQLSTASFTTLTGGLCCLLFALFHYVIDVRGWGGWSYPLRVIGRNSLVAYLAPGIICFAPLSRFFFGGLGNLVHAQAFVLAIGSLLACWSFLWLLDRADIHLKA